MTGCPVHAGMVPAYTRRSRFDDRLPRTRGDGPWHPLRQRNYGKVAPVHAGMVPPRPRGEHGQHRMPRTRGDGPRIGEPRELAGLVTPYTRGWSLYIPALSANNRGLPRTRGDRPMPTGSSVETRGLPRTRGDRPPNANAHSMTNAGGPVCSGMLHTPSEISARMVGGPVRAGIFLVRVQGCQVADRRDPFIPKLPAGGAHHYNRRGHAPAQ